MTTAYSSYPTSSSHTPAPQPPSYPQTPSTVMNASSTPGTPLSGISTVAIKDGHEGNRHSTHTKEYTASTGDRLARLGGLAVNGGRDETANSSVGCDERTDYFERVSGWATELETEAGSGAETPTLSNTAPVRQGAVNPGDQNEQAAQTYSPRSTANSGTANGNHDNAIRTRKSTAPGQILLPPAAPIAPKRSGPSLCSPMVPSPPYPTPNTPSIVPPQATVPSSPLPQKLLQGPSLLSPIYQGVTLTNTPYNSPTSYTNSPTSSLYCSAAATPPNVDAPSPASTVTSASVRKEQLRARMVDGVTYDEGVVDTTMRSPTPMDGDDRKVAEMEGIEIAESKGSEAADDGK